MFTLNFKKSLFIIICSLFLFITSLTSTSQNNSYALSCAVSFHKIGTVKEIEPEIILENTYVYGVAQSTSKDPYSAKIFTSPELYAINTYEDVVEVYVNLTNKLSEPKTFKLNESFSVTFTPVKNTGDFNQNKAGSKTAEDLSVNDILIIGGPSHVCDYALRGSFTKSGEIKNILIGESFHSYYYRGIEIEPSIVEETNCDDYSCELSVKFLIGNDEVVLSKGESSSLENNYFKSIKLISANKVKDDQPQIAGIPKESLLFILTAKDGKFPEEQEPIVHGHKTARIVPTTFLLVGAFIVPIVVFLVIFLTARQRAKTKSPTKEKL